MRTGIWSSQVNVVLSLMFVGSFTFGAGLILWHAAFDTNPVANVLAATLAAESQN